MAFDLRNVRVNGTPHPLSPSLDRVDPTKGYLPDNTRLVCFWANVARSALADDVFRRLILRTAANMRH
jgi:hypothetical protein